MISRLIENLKQKRAHVLQHIKTTFPRVAAMSNLRQTIGAFSRQQSLEAQSKQHVLTIKTVFSKRRAQKMPDTVTNPTQETRVLSSQDLST